MTPSLYKLSGYMSALIVSALIGICGVDRGQTLVTVHRECCLGPVSVVYPLSALAPWTNKAAHSREQGYIRVWDITSRKSAGGEAPQPYVQRPVFDISVVAGHSWITGLNSDFDPLFISQMHDVMREIKERFPWLTLVPEEMLHMTLYGLYVDQETSFVDTLSEDRLGKDCSAVVKASKDFLPSKIRFQGLNITPGGAVIIEGHPEDSGIDRMRAALNNMTGAGFNANFVHITLGRTTDKVEPEDFASLVDFISGQRNRLIGTITVERPFLIATAVNDGTVLHPFQARLAEYNTALTGLPMSAEPLDAELIKRISQDVEALAREAGAIMSEKRQEVFGGTGDFGAEIKPDATMVTETDKRIQDIVDKRLVEILPGSCVVGEESFSADDPSAVIQSLRQSHRYVWIVDPIDGTLAFKTKEAREFGIGIALIDLVSGMPVVSLFYAPEWNIREGEAGALFTADSAGQFTYLNGMPVRTRDNPLPHLDAQIQVDEGRTAADASMQVLVHAARTTSIFNSPGPYSTIARLCHVAASGSVTGPGIFLSNSHPKLWDVFTAALILHNAGVTFMYADGRPVFPFRAEDLLAGQQAPSINRIIACSAERRADVLAALAASDEHILIAA